jgi:hypothetical protein
MKLELEPLELKKVQEWREEHDKTCPFADPRNCGCSGGRFIYQITYTTIGTVICACGAGYDFTDYDYW